MNESISKTAPNQKHISNEEENLQLKGQSRHVQDAQRGLARPSLMDSDKHNPGSKPKKQYIERRTPDGGIIVTSAPPDPQDVKLHLAKARKHQEKYNGASAELGDFTTRVDKLQDKIEFLDKGVRVHSPHVYSRNIQERKACYKKYSEDIKQAVARAKADIKNNRLRGEDAALRREEMKAEVALLKATYKLDILQLKSEQKQCEIFRATFNKERKEMVAEKRDLAKSIRIARKEYLDSIRETNQANKIRRKLGQKEVETPTHEEQVAVLKDFDRKSRELSFARPEVMKFPGRAA